MASSLRSEDGSTHSRTRERRVPHGPAAGPAVAVPCRVVPGRLVRPLFAHRPPWPLAVNVPHSIPTHPGATTLSRARQRHPDIYVSISLTVAASSVTRGGQDSSDVPMLHCGPAGQRGRRSAGAPPASERTTMNHPIRVTRATEKKPKPKDSELGFGSVFTDHMFVADFQDEKGWYDPRIEPYGPLSLDPAAAVLHYAQAIFDGLKAFRGKDGRVRLFRPSEARRAHEQLGPPALHPRGRPGARPPVARRPGARRPGLGALERRHRALHPAHGHRERGLPRRPAGQAVRLLRHPVAGRRVLQGRHESGQDPRRGQVRARDRRRARAAPRPARTMRRACAPRRRLTPPASRRCCGSTAPSGSTWTRWAP